MRMTSKSSSVARYGGIGFGNDKVKTKKCRMRWITHGDKNKTVTFSRGVAHGAAQE